MSAETNSSALSDVADNSLVDSAENPVQAENCQLSATCHESQPTKEFHETIETVTEDDSSVLAKSAESPGEVVHELSVTEDTSSVLATSTESPVETAQGLHVTEDNSDVLVKSAESQVEAANEGIEWLASETSTSDAISSEAQVLEQVSASPNGIDRLEAANKVTCGSASEPTAIKCNVETKILPPGLELSVELGSAPKTKGGRSYQETRRSKKSGCGPVHINIEDKSVAASPVKVEQKYVDGPETSTSQEDEHHAKGDVNDPHEKSAKGKVEDGRKVAHQPACDGDLLASGHKIMEKQVIQLSRDDSKKLSKQSPSVHDKQSTKKEPVVFKAEPEREVCSKPPVVAELRSQHKPNASQKKREKDLPVVKDEPLELLTEIQDKGLTERQIIKDEEMKSLQDFINECRERLEAKSILREQNLSRADNRPDESFFVKLDSNLKRNTAFVKKLRNLTETQKDALVKDFNSLNLTMYVGEMADAIVEAKLKMTDIGCALMLCSLIHQRYSDFSGLLLDSWQKVMLTKKDDKVPNASKLRVDLRLFADLVAVGVFTEKEGLPFLANQLTLLTNNDRDEHNNLSIVLSFCKHCGDDYAGLLPRKFRMLAEKHGLQVPRSQVLRVDRQKACRNLLKDYYVSLCKHLLHDCKELRGIEKNNRRILQTKGELSVERKEKQEAATQAFQRLLQNTQALADLLDEDVPSLPEEELKSIDIEGFGMDVTSATKTGAEFQPEGDLSLYDDEDTRQFYENLPDLKAIIPGILYRDSEQAASSSTVGTVSEAVDDELDEEDMQLLAETMDAESKSLDVKVKPPGSSKKEEEVLPDVDSIIPAEVEDDDGDVAGSMKVLIDTFLSNLPNCVNRELIDKASVEFCMNLNTKANRRKLVRALFYVHRTRYDLLPFYGRLVASLNPCVPSIASDLTVMLKTDFRIRVRKKDQINIESKLKTVRFIGELVKFGMFPKVDVLHCLKMLLFDFTHHNIEMACALLETCGRYLYRTPESHQRVKVYLEVMMRKKAALHLDVRYATMIENAFFYSNPPESRPETKLQRPPMHEYIHKLVYKDLSKTTIEKVLRQMRKLDWDSVEIRHIATKCLADVWNLRYNNIHCCANLLAGLAPYEESVGIQVIDSVLEDIWLGLEVNHPKYNQHRISTVKYLGELYNYRMVESQVIFKTLYLFITFGVSYDESAPSLIDPPEHLFRIRLVCILLDACGQYFDRGSSKIKLDCFLVYFQRYYWFKKKNSIWTEEHPFPRDVEYMMFDTIEILRPKLHVSSSWEEASQSAEALDKEFSAKLAELVKANEKTSTPDMSGSLGAIQELDEQEASSTQLTGNTQEDSDDHTELQSTSQTQSPKGEDWQYDESRDQARTFDDEQEYLDSADDEDIDNLADDDDEKKVARNTGVRVVQCQEDDDFMTAFDKMISETLQARVQEVVKIPIVDIAVPVNAKSQHKAKPPQPLMLNLLSSNSQGQSTGLLHTDDHSPEDDSMHHGNAIPFTILSKRGNKQQFSTIKIPVSDTFAAKFKEQIELEKMEKERMKRVVLNIHERQEEEDYQEMIAQMNRQMPNNINRERRVPYQHPKGAPDADVIFGSKRR